MAKSTKTPVFSRFCRLSILVKMVKYGKICKIWQNQPKHPFSLDLEDCPFLSKLLNIVKSAKYGKINQNPRFLYIWKIVHYCQNGEIWQNQQNMGKCSKTPIFSRFGRLSILV